MFLFFIYAPSHYHISRKVNPVHLQGNKHISDCDFDSDSELTKAGMRRVSVMYNILCAVQYFERFLKTPRDRKKDNPWLKLTNWSFSRPQHAIPLGLHSGTVAVSSLLGCPAKPNKLLRSPLAEVDACSGLQRHVTCRLKISQAGILPCQFYLLIQRLRSKCGNKCTKEKRKPEAETTCIKAIITRQNVFWSNINWMN